jgi:hypothetical protein
MTMRTLKPLLLIALLTVGLAPAVSAQTLASTTTLAANLSATAQTMSVSSATGFSVGRSALIDFEVVQITSVNGTTIGIIRGQQGTASQAHDNTERIIVGAINHFQMTDPNFGADCTRGAGQATYLPWINVLTGTVWQCDAFLDNRWSATRTQPITFNSIPTTF